MAVTNAFIANNLQKGSSGNDVLELQKKLNSTGYGYNLAEDGVFGDNTLAAVKDYQQRNNLAVDGIVGTKTWGSLNNFGNTGTSTTTTTTGDTSYQKSQTVTDKEGKVETHKANAPGEFTFSMQEGWDAIMNQILNRQKFSYDLNGDALYQQYKDQYTTQGKMAMMDTMGQAQAMTGGYGNSYAQSVGQQAYQGYMQQLNDKVPELYQLALDQYNREGEDLYNQYALYADKHSTEYGEHRDSVSDYYTELDYLTEDARYAASDEYQKWADNYQIGRDKVEDEQWEKSFNEGVRQFNESIKASNSSSGGNNGTKYKDIEIGSNAYNAILDELATVDSYESLLAFTKKYVGMKYDPDIIEALTAELYKKYAPKTEAPPSTSPKNGSYMSGGIGGRFVETAMK